MPKLVESFNQDVFSGFSFGVAECKILFHSDALYHVGESISQLRWGFVFVIDLVSSSPTRNMATHWLGKDNPEFTRVFTKEEVSLKDMLWESLNAKKNDELISLDMVLVDEDGSLMTAMVRKNLVYKFDHLLKEGNVYVLKNFEVVENSGSFKVVDSKFKIIFTLLTKVEKVDDTQVPSIPMYGFQFACHKTITERLNNDTILTDIMGCLKVVGDVETVRGGFRKRDLEIIPEFNVTCKLTLWGALAENFVDSHMAKNPSGVTLIIIVSSTRVTKYQDVLNFKTSSASKVYVNLNTDYVLELAKRFAHICPRLNLGVSSGKATKTMEEEMFENRMDIHQLLQTDWSNKPKGYIITILGVIEDIGTQYGWFYLGCQGCCRKVNPIDGVYTCASCNVEYKNVLTLYKLHLSVRDDTDVVTCVVLHKLAERMIDSSPLKLLNKSDPNKKELPHEISSLCGQKFVFCLQLSDYNIKYGSDMFTVSKVFDPHHVLEKKYKSVDATTEPVANDEESLNATDSTQPSKISTSTSMRKRKLIVSDDEMDN
ncbi:hypothetical protein OSB04_023858 [Centaurea solstitialis]|uniref:Replication factor A C-terminal domain-containing protein n=1 Tax=Centaurea solstitialis TaxID=347529 RepID=A0AA38SWS4_9ASTR|nr:hypothetical protein OSB04_023858 [Centaurea solstitialis]